MKRYFKINRTNGQDKDMTGWDTDMTLICFDELTGKYTSKRYKTILSQSFQSFMIITDKNPDLLKDMEEKDSGAVEIEAKEFFEISDRLKEISDEFLETSDELREPNLLNPKL